MRDVTEPVSMRALNGHVDTAAVLFLTAANDVKALLVIVMKL